MRSVVSGFPPAAPGRTEPVDGAVEIYPGNRARGTKMKVNLTELAPWADVHRLFSNMSHMRVVLPDGTIHDGEAQIEMDETDHTLTLSLPPAKIKSRPRAIA